jgi:hypothetical protein
VDECDYEAVAQGKIFTPEYHEDVPKIGQDWLKANAEEDREPVRKDLLKPDLLEGAGPFFSFSRGGWEFRVN